MTVSGRIRERGAPGADCITVLRGLGLHTGQPCGIELRRTSGPVQLQVAGNSAPIEKLVVSRSDRGVEVTSSSWGSPVDSVEHLMSALAGLNVRTGIAVRISGSEVPLLDGSALAFSKAILSLTPDQSPPSLKVLRSGEVAHQRARYRFKPASYVHVEVVVDFSQHGLGKQKAFWSGDPEVFVEHIAPARTFGFLSEHARLLATGRAAGANPTSVLVIDEEGQVLPPGRPAGPEELARHKLLDLLGDFYLLGGPPVGSVSASWPGHESNLQALRQALQQGLVGKSPQVS